jgi:hypothetical protein
MSRFKCHAVRLVSVPVSLVLCTILVSASNAHDPDAAFQRIEAFRQTVSIRPRCHQQALTMPPESLAQVLQAPHERITMIPQGETIREWADCARAAGAGGNPSSLSALGKGIRPDQRRDTDSRVFANFVGHRTALSKRSVN